MEAALQKIASQTWYGTNADAEGFQGIASLLPFKNSPMVIDAGGTAASTATSVFAIRTDIQAVQYAWGQNGKISNGEIVHCEQYASNMSKYWGYAQPITGYVGLQVPTLQCIGRICNITAENGKGLTDGLLSQLLELFPVGKKPTMLFMSQRSLGQLRRSRTATNGTGAEAPYPDSVFGIQIYPSEAIINTEAVLAAA
ncbi:MAG: hypothetical protein LBT46_01180 [Planctomycetaceae bacterium]|jgi:hypothetical protein|nr:hypothetical protein [Planctomycetaceae bacterium]